MKKNNGFKDPGHLIGLTIPSDMVPLVHKIAAEESRSFIDAVLNLVVIGLDCRRQHMKKTDHKRTRA